MKRSLTVLMVFSVLLFVSTEGFSQAKAGTLTCVGLYSETGAGSVSYRVGGGEWVVIGVGDIIPPTRR